jgi:ankyrin repeat protein
MTPLRWAVENNLPDTVVKMLKIGVSATLHKCDPATGRNPLGIAVQAQNREMTKLLLAHGADPQLQDLDYRVALDYLPQDLPEDKRRKWEELMQKRT